MSVNKTLNVGTGIFITDKVMKEALGFTLQFAGEGDRDQILQSRLQTESRKKIQNDISLNNSRTCERCWCSVLKNLELQKVEPHQTPVAL